MSGLMWPPVDVMYKYLSKVFFFRREDDSSDNLVFFTYM